MNFDELSLSVADFNYYVSDVIDAREEKKFIGYIVTNKNQKAQYIVNFKENLKTDMLRLFNNSFQQSPNKIPIYVRINHLFIYSPLEYECPWNRIELNMDIFTQHDNSFYHEFQAVSYAVSGAEHKSKNGEQLLINAIEKCLNEFNRRMKNQLGYHQQVDSSNLYNTTLEKFLQNITANRTSKKGIYKTFTDFRDNIIDTLTSFYMEAFTAFGKKNEIYLLKTTEKHKKIHDVWGFNDEGKLFINISGLYVPTISRNDSIKFTIISQERISSGVDPGMCLFLLGPVGIVTYGLIHTPKEKFAYYETEYHLDFSIGVFTCGNKPNINDVSPEWIFYTKNFNARKQQLDLYINDQHRCRLKPESYFSVFIPPDSKNYKVCLKSKNDEYCENMTAEFISPEYIEAIIRKNGNVDFFRKQSKFMMDGLEYQIEKGKYTRLNP